MRHTSNKAAALFVAALLIFSLTSCGLSDSFLASLGFDLHDYAGETVITQLDAGSEAASKLIGMIGMLTSETPNLTKFTSPREAVSLYRDSILTSMLSANFARYSCDDDRMHRAVEAYPRMEITVLIPAEEFENTVYTNFGGSDKIAHADGLLFTYLDKVSAYTCVTAPTPAKAEIEVVSLGETENTYKLKFRVHSGEQISPVYSALAIKREDGTVYIKTIEEDK